MEIKILAAFFFTDFVAELGDKTQLATMLFMAGAGFSPVGIWILARA